MGKNIHDVEKKDLVPDMLHQTLRVLIHKMREQLQTIAKEVERIDKLIQERNND